MRVIAGFVVVLVCVGAALAQEAPMVFRPTWSAEPSPTEIVRHYPQQALAQNVSGIGVLCCTPRENRGLDCVVDYEWPAGRGFGAASVRASAGYRLSDESFTDLYGRSDRHFRLSMMWAGPILTPEMQQQLLQIDRDTAYACLPD